MSKHHPYPDESDMTVRVMVGDPIAIAWLWIEAYVENLNQQIKDSYDMEERNHELLTVDELIGTALSHIANDSHWGREYIIRGGVFEGSSMDPTFWDKLSILKEIEIDQSDRGSFFSCSC